MPKLYINPSTGLTTDEQIILELSSELFSLWCNLPKEHPDDAREICDAVHVIQRLLAIRVARRAYPEGWPVR